MARTRNSSSWLQSLLLLGICFAIIVGIPAQPVRAAIQQNQDLDNSLADFDKGSFQLTASANFPTGTPSAGDTPGAVQLAPIAALRSMTGVTGLPLSRQDAGVVAVGRNIFVIGGSGDTGSGTGPTSTVYVSQVSLDAASPGALGPWNSDPDLPAVIHNTSPPTPVAVAPRTSPAVAAYVTGQDSGYIYMVGGQVVVSGSTISSFSVLRGTVTAGRVTSWDALPNLPAVTATGAVGLANASAFVAQVNGSVFLYVIGGLQIYRNGASTIREGSRKIIYAQLDASGSFSAWNTTQFTLPLNPDPGATGGVWSAAVVGGAFRDASGLNANNNFYILGGQTKFSPATFSSAIYRADIANDGILTLSNPSGAGVNNASLGLARSGHAAVQFNGSVYAAGGVVQGGSGPNQTILGSYVQTNRTFPELGGPGSATYFISKTNPAGFSPRSGHGMVVIPYPFSSPTKGFVYLIGGSDGSAAQTTIFRGTISDSEATDVSFPLEGYYVSKPVPFTFASSRLKKIFWGATIPSGAGIDVSFRVSNDAVCADLGNRNEILAPWTSAPVTNIVANQYESALNTDPVNCFQYRARLTPTNNSDTNATPYLLRLGVVIEVPGAIDLTVKSVSATGPANAITGLSITLHNENIFLPGEPTLPADFGPNGAGSFPGSFFVDVFVYPPGVTPPATQPYPTVQTAYSRLSIDVLRNELQAGPGGTGFDFIIPANRPLCDYNIAVAGGGCVPRTMRDIFPTPGVYKVVVVVDGDSSVDEQPNSPNQAKSNNVFGPVDINVTEIPPESSGATVYLPAVLKP